MRSRVYETVERPSSVCLSRRSTAAAACGGVCCCAPCGKEIPIDAGAQQIGVAAITGSVMLTTKGRGSTLACLIFFSSVFTARCYASAVLATTVCALVHRRQNRDGCGYYESLGFTVHLQLFSDISARSYFKMGQRVLALQLEISDLASGTILGGTV